MGRYVFAYEIDMMFSNKKNLFAYGIGFFVCIAFGNYAFTNVILRVKV
jgi:hypothetical protein